MVSNLPKIASTCNWNWIGENEKQLNFIIAVIKIFFSIAAAGYAFWLYQAKITDDKIQKTMQYITESMTGNVAKAELYRSSYWADENNTQKMDNIYESKGKTGLDQYLLEVSKTELSESIRISHNFYRSMSICVNCGLCDAKTACDYFKKDLKTFLENYNQYFLEYKRKWNADPLSEIKIFLKNHECRSP